VRAARGRSTAELGVAVKYLLDTSIVNKLVDGSIMPSELPQDGTIAASNIQLEEIRQTRDPDRKSQLLSMFYGIVEEITPIVPRADDDGRVAADVRNELNARNNGKASNSNDAVLAELAMRQDYVLLTADLDLYEVAYVRGVGVMYWTTPNRASR
jgi:predicted nucleic acid-binding protein